MLRNRTAMLGACVLLIVTIVAVAVPLLVHTDPYQADLLDSLLPPGSPDHLLGTDQFGRDVLLRLLYGARLSLAVGVVTLTISASLGSLIGLVAGTQGGRVDQVLMRLIDVQLAFPGILAALVIVTVLGNGLQSVILAVGLAGIPRYARVVRASVLSTRHLLFVDAARSGVAPIRRTG